ncbi:DUF4396 domain-containing protein [Mesorhizobium sp. B2-3-13]|uniref:DUF4396 domain-containing protein n=1 Tax=Mesorhizobium sp. B2-3-13 TaxID=2589951 RepID=UPI001FEF5F70|nr:DUF4396 domain-containing protein [Mesorhizobium sp. B2-3-13]
MVTLGGRAFLAGRNSVFDLDCIRRVPSPAGYVDHEPRLAGLCPLRIWLRSFLLCALRPAKFQGHSRAANRRRKELRLAQDSSFADGDRKGSIALRSRLHCGRCHCRNAALAFPTVLLWLGWKSLFAERTISVWILDYIFAFGLGIAFQYFTIKPMRQLSAKQGFLQALKADALSLTAWQVGMYGLMGVGQFLIFKPVFGTQLEANTPEFWFLMQLAMLAGFATSYPVNWWLLRKGIKELM